jgi:hypothetical protein
MSVLKKYMTGLYWSFYSVRFEPRIPAQVTASEAWGYKNIYPLIKGAKPEHRNFILVSRASIGQSQLGSVNDLHPLKVNVRALYKLLVENIKQQTGFVDVKRLAVDFVKGSQAGKTLFIVNGQYLEPEAIKAVGEFMKNGGAVVGFGPVGLYDAYGRWTNDVSSKITGAEEVFSAAQADVILDGKKYKYSNKTYLFKPGKNMKSIITANAKGKYYLAYMLSQGKGAYYQFGIEPQHIKSGKGYDNVDEALIKKRWISPDARLQQYVVSSLMQILKDHKSIQKYYSDDKYSKLILKKKGDSELLFVFNLDLLNPRTIKVVFPENKKIEILYDKGIMKAGTSSCWSGSIAPGGCRLLRLK